MTLANKLLSWLLWMAIISLSLYFFLDNVVAYFFGYRSELFGETLFESQAWVSIHMAGGTLLLFLGPFQFWRWFRNRYTHVHRFVGKVYLAGAALAGLSALWISTLSRCVPCRISLFLLTVFMLTSTAFAWITVRNGNITAHRQFMIRSYICALAFVTVRIDGILTLNFLFGNIEDETFRRTVNEYFFSFVPLIVAEIFMIWIPATFKARKQKIA